jgi:hypothetical protein
VEDATDADDVCRLLPEGDEVSGMVEIHREPRSERRTRRSRASSSMIVRHA